MHILTRWSNPATARSERVGGVPVMRLLPAGRGPLKKWGLVLSSLPWLLAQRHHYDVIFVSGFRILGMTAVLVSLLLGKGCLLKADSQGEMSGAFFTAGLRRVGRSPNWPVFRLFLWLRNRLLSQAAGFAAISDGIEAELAAQGVPLDKIYRIPNSVDTGRFAPANAAKRAHLRAKLGLPLVGPIAIYTGRLVSYKGLPQLLGVWLDTLRRHPGAHLLLVGTGGLDIHNCEAELRDYVKANGLATWVTFTGGVPNVEEYLQATDVFVLPTKDDAFPSSLVEAMACGVPVISTSVGAIPSIITHNQNGLLIDPANQEQLSQAVDRLLSDRILAGRLGQAARKTVNDRYSADSVTRAYIALFQSMAPHLRPNRSLTHRPDQKPYE